MPNCPNCHNLTPDDATFCDRCGEAIVPGGGVRTFAAGYQLENGRYVVESLLGGGGMGNVYKAKDTRLNRVVALKVLHADLVSHPTARRRMTREAEALARVTHPNVVQIFDVFDHPPHLILVLDLIDGHELGENLESGMAEDKAVALMTQILSGMEAIHEANLVHRDIKPANILVSNKGKPMITDLGVAHDSTQRGQTKMGARLGTVEYMSPEQVQGTSVDVRSDIYSLGIVLFEMLAGSLPFKGNTDFDFMTAHVSHEPNLALLTGKASTHITAVITKALAKKPDDRWATAAEMNKALHDPKLTANVRESAAQAPAKEPAIAKPIESPALPAAPLKEQDSYDAPAIQRNMTPIVVGALVVVLLIISGYFLLKKERKRTVPNSASSAQAQAGSPGSIKQKATLDKSEDQPDDPALEEEVDTATSRYNRPGDLPSHPLAGEMASAFQVLNVSQFSDLWGKSPSQIPLLRKIQPLEIKDTRTWQKMYKSSISSRELRRKGLYVRWVFMDDQLYRIRLGFKKKAPSFLSAFRRSIGRPPDKVFTDPWNIQESLWTDGDQRVLVGTKDSRVAFSIESKKLGIEAQARLDKVYQVENYHWQSQSRLYVKKDKFNIQEAERVNTLAVKEFPGFGDGWVNLCNIRYSLGDFADAIQYCDKARTVTQEQSVVAEADYFRGLIYFAQDDKYSGIAKLESALANRKVHHDLKKDSRLMLKGQRGDFSREVLKRAIKKYDQFAEKGLYKRASYVPKNFGAPSIEWLRRRY